MSEVAVIDNREVVQPTPANLLQMAVEKGASIEHIEKLMELELRWEANNARKAFVAAMSAFRSEAPSIAKESRGHNSDYASLPAITSKVNPILAKHGLSFGWVTEQGEAITVHCDVTHVDGHSQRVSLSGAPDTGPGRNSIQAIGSTVSYLSRYTLLSALGLATGGQDTDGNVHKSEFISGDQVLAVEAFIKENKLDQAQILQKLKSKNIESFEAIPNNGTYEAFFNWIKGLAK